MRIVLQRVSEAHVAVEGKVCGAIGRGLLILVAVSKTDTEKDAAYLADKVLGLRVFPDEAGKMNLSVQDAGGSLLVVSQFTLYGNCSKGRRPSFDRSAGAETAKRLYEYFIEKVRERGIAVEAGIFQATMAVHLVNEGPVTLLCDSEREI